MLQVELRDRMSTLRFCNSLKRSLASRLTNFTFFGSSKMAAATARQKSTSKPDQLPLSSGVENPGRPVLTPHGTARRRAAAVRPVGARGVLPQKKPRSSAHQNRNRKPDHKTGSKRPHRIGPA